MFFEKTFNLSDQKPPNTVDVLGYRLDNSKLNGIGNIRIAPLKWVSVLLFVVAVSFPSIFSEFLDLKLSSAHPADPGQGVALAPEAKAGAVEKKKLTAVDIWPDDPKPDVKSEARPAEVQSTGTQAGVQALGQSQGVNGEVGLPRRLVVPAISVDANVQQIGVSRSGEMETPSSPQDAGWYGFGSRPGANGNAVIAGHLDTASGKAAVFWNLHKLNAGDYIYVVDEFNNRRRFRVTGKDIYDEKTAPIDQIFGQNVSGSELKLITCAGVWDRQAETYNKRLVVSAEYLLD